VNFTCVTVPAPIITSLCSTNRVASGRNTVLISGTNLLYTTSVIFGTAPASSFATNIRVAAVVPAGTGATAVSVANGTGTSGTLPYTYNRVAAPIVSTVSPTGGPAVGGNTAVINRFGFTYTTAVTFGSSAATLFHVVSEIVIDTVVPLGLGAGRNVSVQVTRPSGTGAASTTYTYVAALPPTIIGLTLVSGPVLGGNTVTFIGLNLNGATAVTFAGNAASSLLSYYPLELTLLLH
jgi:hypothetical protein